MVDEPKDKETSPVQQSSEFGRRASDHVLLEILEKVAIEDAKFKLQIQKDILDLAKKVELVLQHQETYIYEQENHRKLLYGNPENLGRDGLIAQIQHNSTEIANLEKETQHEINKAKILWGSIAFFGGLLWAWIMRLFDHAPKGP